MADEEFGRRVPFAFLEDIKNRFKSAYGNRGKTAMAYAMNEEFGKVLKKQMASGFSLYCTTTAATTWRGANCSDERIIINIHSCAGLLLEQPEC